MGLSLTEPAHKQEVFVCFYCMELHAHTWASYDNVEPQVLTTSTCNNCAGLTVWVFEHRIFPRYGQSIIANPDIPETAKPLFQEASELATEHPNASAVLARHCLHELVTTLAPSGEAEPATQAAALHAAGLTEHTRHAMETLRVIGPEAITTTKAHFDDVDPLALLALANQITTECITQPTAAKTLAAEADAQVAAFWTTQDPDTNHGLPRTYVIRRDTNPNQEK